MNIGRTYYGRRFSADTIRHARDQLPLLLGPQGKLSETKARTLWHPGTGQLAGFPGGSSSFDTDDEFFAEYREGAFEWCHYSCHAHAEGDSISLTVHGYRFETAVTVDARQRHVIDAVFEIFESALSQAFDITPRARGVSVFIGHGRSEDWRELKDHLREKQGYKVDAFEIGARAGHSVVDILEDMLDKSSFACLVMTGEDETGDGAMRARQNVVHEAGLFQGRLGFTRAIAIVEEGVEVFSNLDGIQRLEYPKGQIRAVFGDVLATLRREFGTST